MRITFNLKQFITLIILNVISLTYSLVTNNFTKDYIFATNLDQSHQILTIDFLAPSPSQEQVQELNSLQHINNTIPFIFSNIDYTFNDIEYRLKTHIYDLGNFEGHFFDRNNLLYGGYDFSEGNIWIDNNYAERLGLKVGDNLIFTLRSKIFSFKVDSIFQSTIINQDGIIAFSLSEEIRLDIFGTKILSYSGIYISSNSISDTNEYLRDYKPYGRLEEDSTPEEIEAFENNSYYLEITQQYQLTRNQIIDAKNQIIRANESLLYGLIFYFTSFTLVLFSGLIINYKVRQEIIMNNFNKLNAFFKKNINLALLNIFSNTIIISFISKSSIFLNSTLFTVVLTILLLISLIGLELFITRRLYNKI